MRANKDVQGIKIENSVSVEPIYQYADDATLLVANVESNGKVE